MTRKPALVSMATVRLMKRERDRTHFNHEKSGRELGLVFRPVREYGKNGWLKNCSARGVAFDRAGESAC